MTEPSLVILGERLAALEAQAHAQTQVLDEMRQTLAQVRQLVGPFAVPVSPDDLLVQSLFGHKYHVPVRDQLITPQLVVYRQWEPQLSRLLPSLAPSGAVFVDVGANFGYFTCLVAALMGATPGSRVIAVEPNPEMLRLLDINIRINWSMAPVRVVAAALAEAPGRAMLHVPANAAGNASLAAGAAAATAAPVVEVALQTLDDILCEEPRIDLIKIDVEGFEMAVLRGGSATLLRPGLKIVFEWAQRQTRAAGFEPAETLRCLRAAGYALFNAETYLDARPAAALADADILALDYANLLAIRD